MRKSLRTWTLAALAAVGLGSAGARAADKDLTEGTQKSESQKAFDTDRGSGQPDARLDASTRADIDKAHRTDLAQNKKQLHGIVQEVKADQFTLRSDKGKLSTLKLEDSTALYGAGDRTLGMKELHPGDEIRASFTGSMDAGTATEIHVLKSVDDDVSRTPKHLERDEDVKRK